MKNKNINMLIVALLVIGAMAVMLWVFLWKAKEDFPKDITVDEDGTTETILPIRDLALAPTESKEYTVNLFCKASGGYYISLDYEEKENGGLKPFVKVTVFSQDETYFEGSLAELLGDAEKIIKFEGELRAKDPLPITFRYEMPSEIGNEAQGTYADFDIHLSIKKS